MTGTYTIRQLEANDAEAWAMLRQEALELHPLAFGASPPDDADQLVQAFTRIIVTEREHVVFGAFAGNSVVGIVGIRRHTGQKQQHKTMLWGMYVTASHRGAGVGERLLSAAIEQARLWPGIEQVCLAVSDVAAEARKLYEKFGFREWGREPRAICCQGQCADEMHMVLELPGG